MGRSVNKVILVGYLGKDAETKFTQSGVAKTTFSIATSRRWKDKQTDEWKEETDWHNVVLWRQENLATYLTKGKQIYVEGRLQTRNYEDKDGRKVFVTEVVGEDVLLLGGSREENGNQQASRPNSQGAAAQASRSNSRGPAPVPVSQPAGDDFNGISDEDVPF